MLNKKKINKPERNNYIQSEYFINVMKHFQEDDDYGVFTGDNWIDEQSIYITYEVGGFTLERRDIKAKAFRKLSKLYDKHVASVNKAVDNIINRKKKNTFADGPVAACTEEQAAEYEDNYYMDKDDEECGEYLKQMTSKPLSTISIAKEYKFTVFMNDALKNDKDAIITFIDLDTNEVILKESILGANNVTVKLFSKRIAIVTIGTMTQYYRVEVHDVSEVDTVHLEAKPEINFDPNPEIIQEAKPMFKYNILKHFK